MTREAFQPNIAEAQFPREWVSGVSTLIDQAQAHISSVHGLDNGFQLIRAFDHLYPKKTNRVVEDYYAALEAFNVDSYPPSNVPIRKMLDPRTLYNGRPRFVDLGFVIAAHPERLPQNLISESLEALFLSRHFYEFNIITEETSHFLHNQIQYDLNYEIPSGMMSEAMALVDMYLVGREIIHEAGQPLDNTGELAEAWRTYLLAKIEAYKKKEGDPMASNYSTAASVIEGYLRYLMDADMNGDSLDAAEARRFYRLSEVEKIYYLHRLYGSVSGQKDDSKYQRWQRNIQYLVEYPGPYFERN